MSQFESGLLHGAFEEIARMVGEKEALRYKECRLSYEELDQAADRVAQGVRALGLGPESLVGVLMQRSPKLVIALLGTLKAGAAYLPLDPQHPEERILFMIEDSGASLLMTEPELVQLAHPDVPVLVLDDLL